VGSGKFRQRVLVIFGLILFSFNFNLFQPVPSWADEGPTPGRQVKKERLTPEELLETDAAKLFITHKYAEALEEFKKLSGQYPKDNAIKKYIGACLFHLDRDQEAAGALSEVLKEEPNDLVSHDTLAKIYLRGGDLDSAQTHFSFIVENDKTGQLAAASKDQLDTIKKLREASKKTAGSDGQLAPDEFLKTKAAQLFVRAEYEKALTEFEALEAKLPQNMLVKRYKAMTLDGLKRYDEAIAEFDEGIKISPDSPSLHYFLAQTLIHKQDFIGADRELAYVETHDSGGAYLARAKADRAAVQRILEALKRPKPKLWTLSGNYGAEHNTNATSESRITPSTAEEHAMRFPGAVGLVFNVYDQAPWKGKISYDHNNSYYGGTIPSLNTFSHAVGTTLSRTDTVAGRSLSAQLGQTTTYTQIDHKYYSLAAAPSATIIYSFADWHRVTLSENITHTTYKNEGTDPSRTSRKGWGYLLSVTNNFYLNKEKDRYVQFVFDWGADDPRGANNVKDAFGYKLAYYFPFIWGWDASAFFKFKYANFPEYGTPAGVPTRFDQEYTSGLFLSRSLNANWSLSLSYNFTDNLSKDNTYTYDNHATGFRLSFSY